MTPIKERLKAPGPKRILALDGGGIRGVLTLGLLERMESVLRKQHDDPKLLLCDYFDLIGGTSTGSILAAALSIGMSATEVKNLYFELGGVIFGKKKSILNYLMKGEKYDVKPLNDALQKVFGDIRLGDPEKIKTGMCIVTKRADTQSTWPFINHPDGTFYEQNKDIPLWQIVRASAAAPTYFLPLQISVGINETGTFIDGGISMANNPSFLLLMIAVLKGFPFQWETGPDKILMASCGTGFKSARSNYEDMKQKNLLAWAGSLPNYFLYDANFYNQMIMQIMSNSPTAKTIDSEIGNLQNDNIEGKHLLHYLRYDLTFEKEYLQSIGLDYTDKTIKGMEQIDSIKFIEELYQVGSKAGPDLILPDHFPSIFKTTNQPEENRILRFSSNLVKDIPFENYTKKQIPVGAFQVKEPFEVNSMEGKMHGKPGDYLMKGPRGELYVCDQKIFYETYEKLNP